MAKNLTAAQRNSLIEILALRFESNKNRHPDLIWSHLLPRLKMSDKLWSIAKMEETSGEPDDGGSVFSITKTR